jgi:hypothetical protein
MMQTGSDGSADATVTEASDAVAAIARAALNRAKLERNNFISFLLGTIP